jgi:hypothetical protein
VRLPSVLLHRYIVIITSGYIGDRHIKSQDVSQEGVKTRQHQDSIKSRQEQTRIKIRQEPDKSRSRAGKSSIKSSIVPASKQASRAAS